MRPSLSPVHYPELTAEILTHPPVARAETIPSAWYVDPRFHELDREAVFAPAWHCLGAAQRVQKPGDAIRGTAAGEPILVVRDKAGELRAFYNVCRHRGGPLLMEAGCGLKALTCKYHGWTYLLDGSLRGVPKWDRVELFDRKDYGLLPLRVEVWEGLVFVHLDLDAPPVSSALAGIAERLGPGRLAGMRFERRVTYPVKANWKVYVDNYLEGYHIPYVHPELMTALDFQAYQTEVRESWSLQSSPLSTEEANPWSGTAGGEALYYHIFPNLMLNLLPGRMQVNMVEPLAPDRCQVHFDSYYEDSTTPGFPERIEDDHAYSDRVQAEDAEICERVQEGLASRAYDRGRFSVECEEAVHHFQGRLKQAYTRWMSEKREMGSEK